MKKINLNLNEILNLETRELNCLVSEYIAGDNLKANNDINKISTIITGCITNNLSTYNFRDWLYSDLSYKFNNNKYKIRVFSGADSHIRPMTINEYSSYIWKIRLGKDYEKDIESEVENYIFKPLNYSGSLDICHKLEIKIIELKDFGPKYIEILKNNTLPKGLPSSKRDTQWYKNIITADAKIRCISMLVTNSLM